MDNDKSIYELQAEICKTLANAKRLEIIDILKDGEKTVGELVEILNISSANTSQHLAVMRHKGVLKNRKVGASVYYSLTNTRILDACGIMKQVLSEQFEEQHRMFEAINN